jgi:hypothetical protein
LSLSFLETNFVAFPKSLESFALYFREVHKQVLFSFIRSNEPIPFGFIEPFYLTLHHKITSFPVYKKTTKVSKNKLSWLNKVELTKTYLNFANYLFFYIRIMSSFVKIFIFIIAFERTQVEFKPHTRNRRFTVGWAD